MQKVGLLTGLSYVSGVDYFQGINEQTSALVPLNGRVMKPNPPVVLVSLNCEEYVNYLASDEHKEALYDFLFAGVMTLYEAKIDFLVICSNTAHLVVPRVMERLPQLPILHIGSTSAVACRKQGYTRVGLLGTEPTMRDGSWLKSRLSAHGLDVVVPLEVSSHKRIYDQIIVQELSFEIYKDESRDFLLQLVAELKQEGCQCVILGCTELELLLSPSHEHRSALPLVRSAAQHITACARVLAQVATLADFEPPTSAVQ